ncbi:MAG: hypothetical protein AAF989_10485 [Planctomycetota bacterium]
MWFAFDGHSFETFNIEDEARAHAEHAMDDWSDDAMDGGWNELATQVCYGKITHGVHVKTIPASDADLPDGYGSLEEHTLEKLDDS